MNRPSFKRAGFVLAAACALLAAASGQAGPPYDILPNWDTAKAAYGGEPYTFVVIGECKNGCRDGIADDVEAYVTANHSDQFFSATLGDMIAWPPECGNFSSLTSGFGEYMDGFITWPARGDQEPESCFLDYYDLPATTYYFDLGPARYIVINYTGFGQHPNANTTFTNAETGETATLRQVLEEAKAEGRYSIVFGHVQWFMRTGVSGRKGYCSDSCNLGETGDVCPCGGSDTVALFEQNDVRLVFQADNPGYNRSTVNGIEYIHASHMSESSNSLGRCRDNGGWGDVEANCEGLFVEVRVDGGATVVKVIEAPSGNVIDTVTVQPDSTPPGTPQSLSAQPMSDSRIDLSWSASTDPESGVSVYRVYRDGVLIGLPESTGYSDDGLAEGTAYTYEVSAVNGGGTKSGRSDPSTATTLADTTPPTLVSATAVDVPTRVTVVYSEPVEQSSATAASNYAIDNGVAVTAATLETDLVTVALTTSPLSEGIIYTLTVDNVRDRAQAPNTIASGSTTQFDFEDTVAVEVRIAAPEDDVEESSGGSVSSGSSDLELVQDGTSVQSVGMRFRNIEVPQGATIVDAWVQFQVDETGSGGASLLIEGDPSDSAAAFDSVSSRPRTTAKVSWAPPAWGTVGEAGFAQRTPNLASIVQEIVNRPGWAAGNALALIVTGSGTRTAESYDGDSAAAALLHVEYSTGPPPDLDPPTRPTGLRVR